MGEGRKSKLMAMIGTKILSKESWKKKRKEKREKEKREKRKKLPSPLSLR